MGPEQCLLFVSALFVQTCSNIWVWLQKPSGVSRGYLKGHDPEVSKAPTRRSCFRDITSYVYMSLWLDQRSHEKVERSIPARQAISEA